MLLWSIFSSCHSKYYVVFYFYICFHCLKRFRVIQNIKLNLISLWQFSLSETRQQQRIGSHGTLITVAQQRLTSVILRLSHHHLHYHNTITSSTQRDGNETLNKLAPNTNRIIILTASVLHTPPSPTNSYSQPPSLSASSASSSSAAQLYTAFPVALSADTSPPGTSVEVTPRWTPGIGEQRNSCATDKWLTSVYVQSRFDIDESYAVAETGEWERSQEIITFLFGVMIPIRIEWCILLDSLSHNK